MAGLLHSLGTDWALLLSFAKGGQVGAINQQDESLRFLRDESLRVLKQVPFYPLNGSKVPILTQITSHVPA